MFKGKNYLTKFDIISDLILPSYATAATHKYRFPNRPHTPRVTALDNEFRRCVFLFIEPLPSLLKQSLHLQDSGICSKQFFSSSVPFIHFC